MRKLYLPCIVFFLLFFQSLFTNLKAQCTAGYSAAGINWDAMAFLHEGLGTSVTTSVAQYQRFAFAKNVLSVTHNYSAANSAGETTVHTGETGSYGSGADVEFKLNGTVTLRFQSAVNNVKFSLYDIDYDQRVSLLAYNAGIPVLISMNKVSGTNLTIVGSGTTTPTAKAGATNVIDLASTEGTLNIDIANLVDSIRIIVTETQTKTNGQPSSQEDGRFWLSDISACTPVSAFATNYHSVSQPFNNQPGYVMIADGTSVYQMDPVTGKAKFLFSDPSNQNINSMGYDPYNKILYFTNSLTSSGNTRNIKKYDFNTNTLSVLIADVTATLGIPTFNAGVESGGASFYDGALYIGIEGTGSQRSIVWKINFDGALNPVSAVQVFGIESTPHDWGDFVVANGTLYDFDGSSSGGRDVYHLNLNTGALTQFTGGFASISQTAVNWNGQIYNVGTAVAPYDNNGNINSGLQQNITLNGAALNGSRGDGAEAFKPKADFGDAPATYDPVALSPALHETISNLYLGNGVNVEWNKIGSSALANDDVDDGMPFVQIITSGSTYYTDVNVFNNTGANATLCAWVDFNNDGIFDAGEGITQTIAPAATVQTVNLFWSGIGTSLPVNSHTYIRIRITSAVNGMTTANPTGFYPDGEVEDYRVVVNSPILPTNLLSFNARKFSNTKVQLSWEIDREEINGKYELQKSQDGKTWTKLHEVLIPASRNNAKYQYNDSRPYQPESHYRLVVVDKQGTPRYSNNKKVEFNEVVEIKMYPNPASNYINIDWYSAAVQSASVMISSASGKKVFESQYYLHTGVNTLSVPLDKVLSQGVHHVTLIAGNQKIHKAIMIQHQK